MFAEWLEAKLAERGWSAADLTAASRDEERPRGLDSGLISRWRRKDALAVVPTQAKTLTRLARALGVPESEVYRAAGLTPADMKDSARSEVSARRQALSEQLDRWLSAVGVENEEFFWAHLKAQGDSAVDLIKRIGSAVSGSGSDAVNGAVSDRSGRGRKQRGTSDGPLTRHYESSQTALNSARGVLALSGAA